jgi:hypothetical protein
MGVGDAQWGARFGYDAQGRWTTYESTGSSRSVTRCTYDGERIAACTLWDEPASIVRDARGRITRVTIGAEVTDVRYGARGEVIAVGESTLRYDTRGRLSAFTIAGERVHRSQLGDFVLERDASGKVIRETGPREVRTFEYDPEGRVTLALAKRRPWPLSSEQPRPPAAAHDAISGAGVRWGPDEIGLDWFDGPVEPPLLDPETERREMLASIEKDAVRTAVTYDGARVTGISSGKAHDPRGRYGEYVYACSDR